MTAVTAGPPETAAGEQLFLAYPIEAIAPSPLNPRRHWNEAAIDALMQSLLASGQDQPVIGRVTDREVVVDGVGWPVVELAAGHRRLKAAGRGGIPTLKLLRRVMDDVEFIRLINTENLNREDVHPQDEAEGFQRMLELPGYDVARVAAETGRAQSHIYQRLRLLSLLPEAQAAFLADAFHVGHAVYLARLQPDDQRRALEYLKPNWTGSSPSVKEFARWIRHHVFCDLAGAPFKLTDSSLLPAAGACGTCPKRTGHQNELALELPDGEEGGTSKRQKAPDRCLDPGCFQSKVAAHLDAKRAELAGKGLPVLEISEGWDHNGAKKPKAGAPLMRGQWFEAKKSDPKAKPALVVDGDQVGHVKYVTTDRPRTASPSNDDYRARELAAAKRRRKELDRRLRIATALVQKVTGSLTIADFRSLGLGYIKEMTHDGQRAAAKMLGLEPTKAKRGGTESSSFQESLERHVRECPSSDLTGCLVGLSISHNLVIYSYGTPDKPEALLSAAERWGVDVAAIDREIAAAAKTKAPKGKPTAKSAGVQKKATLKAKPKKKRAGDVARAKAAKKAKTKGAAK